MKQMLCIGKEMRVRVLQKTCKLNEPLLINSSATPSSLLLRRSVSLFLVLNQRWLLPSLLRRELVVLAIVDKLTLELQMKIIHVASVVGDKMQVKSRFPRCIMFQQAASV